MNIKRWQGSKKCEFFSPTVSLPIQTCPTKSFSSILIFRNCPFKTEIEQRNVYSQKVERMVKGGNLAIPGRLACGGKLGTASVAGGKS